MQTHMNARIRLHPLGKVGRHAFAKIAAADDEIYLRIESGQEQHRLAGRISCSDHVQWTFVAQKRFDLRRGIVDTGTRFLKKNGGCLVAQVKDWRRKGARGWRGQF